MQLFHMYCMLFSQLQNSHLGGVLQEASHCDNSWLEQSPDPLQQTASTGQAVNRACSISISLKLTHTGSGSLSFPAGLATVGGSVEKECRPAGLIIFVWSIYFFFVVWVCFHNYNCLIQEECFDFRSIIKSVGFCFFVRLHYVERFTQTGHVSLHQ